MLFTELNLHPSVMQGIQEAGFVECTPVQETTFQKTLAGTDVMVQSQTGTGKTAAFLITMFHKFLTDEKYRYKKALILTPTRELAVQVEQDAMVLGKYCDIKTGCFYGGVGYATQDRLLREDVNIYIGTPGRLIDYQKSHKIDFLKFEILVIDEADRMFDMGFIPDIRYMLRHMVPPSRRQTMLFSATLSQRVRQLAWEYMNDPAEIEINPEHLTVDLITQELYHIGRDEKFNLLLGILKTQQPKSALIFTNMKRTAERVSRRLTANGINNDYISGDLPQSKRLQIIEATKAGETEILVATDVAARGLHIEDLDMVINYDLPDDNQNYVHRIGRTARAGKTGKAISLATEEDVYNLIPIEKLIGMKIPVKWADETMLLKAAGAPISSSRRERGDRGDRGDRRGDRTRDGRQSRDRDRRPRAGAPRREPRREPREQAVPAEAAGPEAEAETPRREQPRPEQRRPRPARPERERRPHPADAAAPEKPAAGEESAAPKKKRRRGRRGKKPAEGAAAAAAPAARPRKERPRKEYTGRKRSGIPKDASPEERLEYFRKKYGENFEKTRVIEASDKKKKPKTLLQSIKGLFGGKKDK